MLDTVAGTCPDSGLGYTVQLLFMQSNYKRLQAWFTSNSPATRLDSQEPPDPIKTDTWNTYFAMDILCRRREKHLIDR